METSWTDLHGEMEPDLGDIEQCDLCGAAIDPSDGGICDDCKAEQEEAEASEDE
jgi:RecJ-like exonuclease